MLIQIQLKLFLYGRLQVDDDEPICARDRWTLKINGEEMVCVSKVQQVRIAFLVLDLACLKQS